jgi:NAD(P)-dependent dehydrogenase (short-subunit alcohol dehydrogenase family)
VVGVGEPGVATCHRDQRRGAAVHGERQEDRMTERSGPLDGHAALVTGGGSGIGFGSAARLAADGAVVTICGRRHDVLAAAAEQLGDRGRFVVCDVQDEDQVAAAVAAATEPLGGLHITVVNAGGGLTAGPIVTGDAAAWRNQLDVNVIGSFLTIKHAAPAIARSGGGSIVAISSIAGSHTHRHLAAYSVSKAALDMLVRNAADELGEFGVRVNAVRPGLVPTDASQPLDADPATRADYLAQMPLGRTGTTDDIAAAVRFLAGPESSWITGQSFGVDGGHSLRRGPDLDGLIGTMFRPQVEEMMHG